MNQTDQPSDGDKRPEKADRSPAQRRAVWLLVALAVMVACGVLGAVLLRPDAAPVIAPAAAPAIPDVDLGAAPPDVVAAIKSAREQVAASPQDAEAWGRLAVVLRAHEFATAANLCFAQAEHLDPADPRWPYLHGVSLAVTNVDEALVCFQRAVIVGPQFLHARLRYGEHLLAVDRGLEALEQFRAVLEMQPQNARAQLGIARVAWLQGDVQRSLQWASRSAEQDPYKRATHELLLRIYHQLGEQQAISQQMAILEQLPPGRTLWDDPLVAMVIEMRRDPEWVALQAQRLAQNGQSDSAIGIFEQLVRDHAENSAFHAELARMLLMTNQPERAGEVLDRALSQHSQSSEIHWLKGIVHSSRQQWQQAAECFREAIKLKPDDADAHLNLGLVLLKQNDRSAAQQELERALQLAPNLAEAHVALGKMLLEDGDRSAAQRHFSYAARFSPNDPEVQRLFQEVSRAPEG